ncbi:hypothetical protein [Sphingobacterium yanglingense]|uniref:Uncharacterized protein n=1 Tax=Sphingobacterium yanglingense TaxID=1437280 RepID=A0A4R6WL61_9SPHI|nr:hypothetical protein [Sphingobacterium yanglingense]TDQ76591.1 hypothetical protein CLV99_3184 [Sphingobacterium yanglingense]
MEITIKIDERNKEAKALLVYLKSLSFVELKSTGDKGSHYDAGFVEKIRCAEEEESFKIDPDNVWESLNLK